MKSESFVHGYQIDADHSLHIFRGSLASVCADALVSSDDNHLSASDGVSAALAAAAGRDIRDKYHEAIKEDRPTLGDVVRTSAGDLPCRHLYHAITIDFDKGTWVDDTALRLLMANLFRAATEDGVRTLGMPAIGTGNAKYDLRLAAQVIMEELLAGFVKTPIEQIILALIGDEAEQAFYERLVRSRVDRCATIALRDRESELKEAAGKVRTRSSASTSATPSAAPPSQTAAVGETVEQFPNLVDEDRLAATEPDRPRLVKGLAELILNHADEEDVEKELLNCPACYGFCGTIEQRLMEYLYLSEKNLREALGPALFRNKDLRKMAEELREDPALAANQAELVNMILRALCFNLVTPPQGIDWYVSRLEELQSDLRSSGSERRAVAMVMVEAGKILERTLKDLLQMYGTFFWGTDCEAQLRVKKVQMPKVKNAGISRMTIGQARDGLLKLNTFVKNDDTLRDRMAKLNRRDETLLPLSLDGLDFEDTLQKAIDLRNDMVHDRDKRSVEEISLDVTQTLEQLQAFASECQRGGFYPDVMRYEGTFENRDGERFVHFVDQRDHERKVRTDERIDARRHYFCFATNNPMHLYPTLIPKN